MSDEELRYAEDDKGRVYLDEIVSHGGDLHFEMLGDQSAMLRFGVEGKCMVTIFVKGGKLLVTGLQDWQDAPIKYALNGKPVDKEPTPHFWRAK